MRKERKSCRPLSLKINSWGECRADWQEGDKDYGVLWATCLMLLLGWLALSLRENRGPGTQAKYLRPQKGFQS